MSTVNFYTDKLSSKLQESISKQLKAIMPEQLSLNQEVALHRERCRDLAVRWSDAREQIEFLNQTMSPGPDKIRAIQTAHVIAEGIGQQMAEALKTQKDLNVSASVVDSKARETLNEQTLMMFLSAVITRAHEFFNDGTIESIERMEHFEEIIRTDVIIQTADDQGLAIESEIFAMLNTVPGPNTQLIG